MNSKTCTFATGTLIATLASLTLTSGASAMLTLSLGGGWQATIIDSDHVSLDVVSLSDDVLVIRKIADFVSIDPITGLPAATNIVFSQIAADASTASSIVFTDELISNHTGVAWSAFRNEILGSGASFDAIASAGFSISPFTTTNYSATFDQVTYSGGLVANGATWTPGLLSGALVINVDLSSSFPVTFVLKEQPMVPTPGAIALLGLAGVVGSRRRRA